MLIFMFQAKETAAKLNKDISGEFERLKAAYGKGISEMFKEAERYMHQKDKSMECMCI